MPSRFRDLRTLDRFRLLGIPGADDRSAWGTCGAFELPSPLMGKLRCIAAADLGWDHVSVSLYNRAPTWAEMEHIKRLFWREDATAMQLHVPPSDHINIHPHCLHIWSPWDAEIPLPPGFMV